MIPIRLRLRNFLSYRDVVEPLDFTSFTVACLTGENGHGKSSLLDAITWTLWGNARSGTDELIHHGAADMEVEFEFALGDDNYRVLRKRNRRGRTGTSVLEFQVQRPGDDRFVALSGDNIRETEKLINRTLRLTYDTFVNTSFLMQGKADQFTMKTPAGRKQVLADILSLEQYERLSNRAKEKAKTALGEVKLIEAQIDEIDRDLARRPQYEADLVAAEAEQERLDSVQKLRQAEIETATERLKAMDAVLSQISTIDETLKTERRRRDERNARHKRLQDRLVGYEAVIAKRDTIEAGMRDLALATEEVRTLTAVLERLNQLREQRDPLEKAIQRQRGSIEQERARLTQQLEQLSHDAAQAVSSESKLRELETQHAAVQEQIKEVSQQRDRLAEVGERLSEINVRRTQLKKEMDEIKAIMTQLDGAGECWICHNTLSTSMRDHLRGQHQTDGKTRGDEHRAITAEQKALADEQTQLKASVERSEGHLQKESNRLTTLIGSMRKQYDDALRATEQLAKLRPALAAVEKRLSSQSYAEDEQAKLREIDAIIESLQHDPAALRAAQINQRNLESFRKPHQDLQNALAEVSETRGDLETVEKDLGEITQRIETNERDRARLAESVSDSDAIKQAAQEAQRALGDAISELSKASQLVGRAKQQLDHCDVQQVQRVQKEAELVLAKKDQSTHDELARAFGKNGVQAMIIDAAIPEIETNANALLERMSDGGMSVTLQTQRLTGQGNMSETLDIQIQSDQGVRAYELFSGGEAFRINFAIRIALAKLLAHRAGARLETLVIDEGFGTQDAQGRDRIVEAIKAVETDFSKILVITHIDELKDVFPVQIQVTKTSAEGSRYVVQHR